MIYGCVCEVTVTKEIDRVSGELHRVQSSLWSKSMLQLQAERKAAKARECRVWHCEISSQSLYVLNIKPSLFKKKKKKTQWQSSTEITAPVWNSIPAIRRRRGRKTQRGRGWEGDEGGKKSYSGRSKLPLRDLEAEWRMCSDVSATSHLTCVFACVPV